MAAEGVEMVALGGVMKANAKLHRGKSKKAEA
jgi:hypothetical protein